MFFGRWPSETMHKPTIIIGSGIGGLTAAARLAHHGVKVLLFEQANAVGGYLNPFKRKGFDFSPGLHFLNDNEEGPFGRSLASVGEELELIHLPDHGFIVQEAGTPATNYSYTLNSGGAGAGMAMTPQQMGANRFPIVSHIKGLFICGTGTPLGPGLIRCSKSGWGAAGAALQRHYPDANGQPPEGTWG